MSVLAEGKKEGIKVTTQLPPTGVGSQWQIENTHLLSGLWNNPFLIASISVRLETMKLWEQLENLTGYNRMLLQGSPGIGKSTELYGWVQYKRATAKVIYINYSRLAGYKILVCCEASAEITRHCFGIKQDVTGFLEILYDKWHPDYMVYDGFTKETNMLHFAIGERFACVVVFCTSYLASAELSSGDIVALSGVGLIDYNMDSGTFEEFSYRYSI